MPTPIYEVRVTAAVAGTRQGDAGRRNVAVVHTFSRHPTLFLGQPPEEILRDSGLEVREVPSGSALRPGVRVSALALAFEEIPRQPVGGASAAHPESGDIHQRFEALEAALAEVLATDPIEDLEAVMEHLPDASREELDELHQRLLGRRPHGNAGDENVRDAVRQALEGGE